jgi:hypothetical protein
VGEDKTQEDISGPSGERGATLRTFEGPWILLSQGYQVDLGGVGKP